MGLSDPRRYVNELEELERCTERLKEASLRDWPKLQHVASTVCEWADRAAVIIFKSGVFPEYAPLAMMIGPGDLSTRPIGWSIFLWHILCGTNNRGGYHVAKAVKDAEGRLIGENGKPLRVVKHRDGSSSLSGEAARVSNLGRIDTYDEVDAIEHWRRRAADYADVCRTLADKITRPGGAVADPARPELNNIDVKILELLAKRPDVAATQYDLRSAGDRKTLGQRLRYLRSVGYVKFPEGRKRTNTITAAGIARLQSFAETSP